MDAAGSDGKATAGTRSVLVAGASGLVGRALVARLCADPGVGVVHALVRRPLGLGHPKLQVHVVDFTALPVLPMADEAYLALGTTIAIAGSREAFRAVDFDANLAVARAAVQAGVCRIGLVSAMGAAPHSRVFYSRTKGELEQALAGLPLDALVIARPALLLGDRNALGQPHRRGEHLGATLDRWLRPILPARLRAIAAEDVAAALASEVPRASAHTILDSARMQGASAAPA